MPILFFRLLLVLASSLWLLARAPEVAAQAAPPRGDDSSRGAQRTGVPPGVILVKGAWPSASDTLTPLPEGGSITDHVYTNQYFGLRYALPPGWFQQFEGPPPSDSGRYVLAQIRPAGTYPGPARGNILLTAQDMFFSPLPIATALELIRYMKDHLQADYKVEREPTEIRIAGRDFALFAYWSPVAALHWYVLATQIRCHTLEVVLTSRDTRLLERLTHDLDHITLPEETGQAMGRGGGAVPVCSQDYARDENLIGRTEPVLTEHRSNPVPVRIIIDKKGKVKHVHFLSAFADQARAITDSLKEWQFRPYLRNGQPVEVETGIMFGLAPSAARSPALR